MPAAEFFIGLPPTRAVAWFKKKRISTANYRDLTAAEHAKSFTVAGITNLDMLSDLKISLDDALANGKPYAAWKKDIFKHLKSKGWATSVDRVTEIFDPATGEYFGGSHRLQRIYRTNMQSAYSAQQYQHYKNNTDTRPYWRYDAVSDARTRPQHMDLDGRIYRHDDPFWSSHYPPNGYNCRCTVTALSDRDVKRSGAVLSHTADDDVITVDKHLSTVNGVRINGKDYTPSIGFDYNPGRMNYRPALDNYPLDLAQAFCVREMGGRDFAYNYQRVEQSLPLVKQQMGVDVDSKLSNAQLLSVRQRLSVFNTYAAGVLPAATAIDMGSATRTVWLSDDTLIKQFNSRLNQGFGLAAYADLPAQIAAPDLVFADKNNSYTLISGSTLVVVKVLNDIGEIFLLSARKTDKKQIDKIKKNLKRIN